MAIASLKRPKLPSSQVLYNSHFLGHPGFQLELIHVPHLTKFRNTDPAKVRNYKVSQISRNFREINQSSPKSVQKITMQIWFIPIVETLKHCYSGEDCRTSSDCNIAKGLCCKLQRRARSKPKKICSYFADSNQCIGPVATHQVRWDRLLDFLK